MATRCGVLFSRYVLDDQWLSFQTTPSRAPGQVVPEEGHFYGVHERGRAIGLYAPRGLDAWTRRTSAKAVLVWTEIEQVDEIWIGQHKVDSLPAAVPRSDVVVVGSGALWTAVQPLELTDLGGSAPIRLVELDGHLALEMYNYTGPAKTFWEMAKPGSFYQGQPRCGFYARTGRAHFDYASGANFAAEVASGALVDEAAPPATYTAGSERPLRVEYARDDRILGIEVDLYEWLLKRRWTQDGTLDWPMHESPYARQSASGQVSVGGATLTCDKGPVWLCACPGGKRYVAAYSGIEMTSLRLEVPGDVVELAEIGSGHGDLGRRRSNNRSHIALIQCQLFKPSSFSPSSVSVAVSACFLSHSRGSPGESIALRMVLFTPETNAFLPLCFIILFGRMH